MTFSWQSWSVRLWLGALLLFGAKILVWYDTASHTPLEWLLHAVTCVLLATLILDLGVRYRIRDIYDSMALLAVYALLVGLLLFPDTAYEDFPRTLLTRVLGSQALVGLEMLGLLLVMCRLQDARMRRLLLPVVAWNGFYWGIWIRWLPVFDPQVAPIALSDALLTAALLFGLIIAISSIGRRAARNVQPHDFRLSPIGFLVLLAALMAVLVLQSLRGTVTSTPLLASAALIGLSWAILWFRRTEKEPMLLEAFFPSQPPSSGWWLVIIAVFLAVSLFAYSLPLAGNDRINQFWLMGVGYGAVGALWYPIVAVVLAMRGMDRQMRLGDL